MPDPMSEEPVRPKHKEETVGFKLVEKNQHTEITSPLVTWRVGYGCRQFYINRAANDLIGLGERVDVYWNAEDRQLAFAPSERSRKAYKINQGLIGAATAARLAGLDGTPMSWEPFVQDGMLVIRIEEPVSVE